MTEKSPIDTLQVELSRMRKPTLKAAVNDVDNIIKQLELARKQLADVSASDQHSASLVLTKLQNPVRESFEAVNKDLRDVSKAQKNFGKTLDKALPPRELPTEHDAMSAHPSLINQAIAMHLLREGHFDVASTFIDETKRLLPPSNPDNQDDADIPPRSPLRSGHLADQFGEMYRILGHLGKYDAIPAIAWARQYSQELEERGSNLEFDLVRLRFIWLLKGPAVNGLPDDSRNGLLGALAYARATFGRFKKRNANEIQRLMAAIVYLPNLEQSPYRDIFEISMAFEELSHSFRRDFCSILGLSAESPLYVAVTAGAISLPQLLKYTFHMRSARTEWTSHEELAFETPLPPSMIYHPIFVCPVLKEQTTDQNPPMILPCGHVICRDALKRMCKSNRFKCPYCPVEGTLKDAKQIKL